LFGDDKAAKVGDIITVTINENATSTQSATTNTAKDSSLDMQAPNVLGLPSSLGIQNFLNMGTQFDPTVNATIANSMQGTGTVTRNGTLTATISALITDIVPGGNLRIEGRRSVTVNNEEQIMVLRGIVRPQDINFDNTIPSTLIADASISYSGEGVVADEQRKGWLAKILSKVWPF
jgi:flagellar L-ring protein precursor FlgH